jgi:hypothetical protein
MIFAAGRAAIAATLQPAARHPPFSPPQAVNG